MTTNKELLVELNALRVSNGKGELASWKGSREKLQTAIATELAHWEAPVEAELAHWEPHVEAELAHWEAHVEADPLAEEADASDLEGQSDPSDLKSDVKAPRGAIGALVIELLVTDMPYVDIIERVKEAYPSARTTARSIASVAMDLRREGIVVPSRRKPAAPKPAKAPEPARENA